MYKFMWCTYNGTNLYVMVSERIAQMGHGEIQRWIKEHQGLFEDCQVMGMTTDGCGWYTLLEDYKGSARRVCWRWLDRGLTQSEMKKSIEKNVAEEYKKIARYLK